MGFLSLWIRNTFLLGLLFGLIGTAMAHGADEGEYHILQARYGTYERNVDVTQSLKELARQDRTFRMGNDSFGIDPHPNHVKTLRIFARGNDGQIRTFEYREGSLIDGSMFKGWGSKRWEHSGTYQGGWGSQQSYLDERHRDRDYDDDRNNDRNNDRKHDRKGGDEGDYLILQARYGTFERNVDVTQRLKELARQDRTFRMGNDSFGIDPHPNHVKVLRIYARGPRGETRTFEYNEGSLVDGAMFKSWGGGNWEQAAGYNGGWGARDHVQDNRYENGGKLNQGNQLIILSAQYGTEYQKIDVLRFLRMQVRDARMEMKIENSALGNSDPAPGVPKMLWVSYSVNGGQTQHLRVAEREWLSLP